MNDSPVLYQIPDSGPPISRARLATVLWIVVESMIFAALLAGFVIMRQTSHEWPPSYDLGGLRVQPPRVVLDAPVINAGLLISAFIVAILAQQAARRGDLRRCRARLTTVTVLGILFVGVVVWEFITEAARGVTIRSGTYGTYWVALTAAHALHVLAGVVWLLIALNVRPGLALPAGGVDNQRVAHLGLYWGFVTVVWMILLVLLHVL
jgi:heme/copper-type cytochrome/quinol oxidase subunit 3